MIRYTQGNLLEAPVDALVNTVNTVGVMGKGIALMFKDRFPENYQAYAAACKARKIEVGKMFVTAGVELDGPKWIINFPTKKHWRNPTKIEWIHSGLDSLKDIIREKQIRSIAIPPLGCGNGGLKWDQIKNVMESSFSDLSDVEMVIYEPTSKYQNIAKKNGIEKLTPARALIAEMVRRYEIFGYECTLIEIQKLAWFLERIIQHMGLRNPLKLAFTAKRYGPYANKLSHLLEGLDGSYLQCDKRIKDAAPFEAIRFNYKKQENLALYLRGAECREFLTNVEATDALIDGFQSPLGLEVLATVDWLLHKDQVPATLEGIRQGIQNWPTDKSASERKQRIFTDRLIESALARLSN